MSRLLLSLQLVSPLDLKTPNDHMNIGRMMQNIKAISGKNCALLSTIWSTLKIKNWYVQQLLLTYMYYVNIHLNIYLNIRLRCLCMRGEWLVGVKGLPVLCLNVPPINRRPHKAPVSCHHKASAATRSRQGRDEATTKQPSVCSLPKCSKPEWTSCGETSGGLKKSPWEPPPTPGLFSICSSMRVLFFFESTNVCLYPADGELAAVCVQAWKSCRMRLWLMSSDAECTGKVKSINLSHTWRLEKCILIGANVTFYKCSIY